MSVEYTAKASGLVSGEVKLSVGEDALAVSALFDAAEIPYARIHSLSLEDYAVRIATRDGPLAFSMMGQWTQPFYDALLDAFNSAVKQALFLPQAPMLTAKGGYSYSEGGPPARGGAAIHVYENCVTLLPPDLCARRVPLCFAGGLDRGDYELTLRLVTGESYSFHKLGHDGQPRLFSSSK